jgi:hypothetical protein
LAKIRKRRVERKRAFVMGKESGHDFLGHIGRSFGAEQVFDDCQ